jgi:hypothetical protein
MDVFSMEEAFPVGTILTINNPSWPRTRQRAKVVGWTALAGTYGILVLRLLADDAQKGDQETPQGEAGTGPVDDWHLDK